VYKNYEGGEYCGTGKRLAPSVLQPDEGGAPFSGHGACRKIEVSSEKEQKSLVFPIRRRYCMRKGFPRMRV
jgi:hypothetical protein